MRQKLCLTAADAEAIVTAARAEAEAQGWAVSIAVVDEAGILWRLDRADDAVLQSAQIAEAKAWTAALSRTPTKALEDVAKDRPGTLTMPGRTPVQGGVPILVDGACVGGIGVSGVKSHEDEIVALAGLRAVVPGA